MSACYEPPLDTGLVTVYVDASLIVLNKPAGLLSVPGRGPEKADSLMSRAQACFADALIVHRLDMGTSGLMVLARGAANHAVLSRMFRQREVHKRYVAWVAGRVAAESGEIDLPLAADWPNRPLQKVDFDLGKPSLTRYRFLRYDPLRDATCLDLQPVSGRSHQLRVHLRELGHPILGDPLYAPAEVHLRANRLLLHASHLALPHPVRGEPLEWVCAPDF